MKKFLIFLLVAMMVFTLVGCGSSTPVEEEKEEATEEVKEEVVEEVEEEVAVEPVTIKLAHYAEIGHPADLAANQFAEKVAERSNGSVIIEVYPANQLGAPDEVLEQNILGTVDMSLPTQGHLSKYSEKFATVMLPFAFDSYEHVAAVLDGPFMDWSSPDLEAQGLVFLSNWDWGFRNVTNSVHPINTPADVAGLKLRTPPEIQLQAAMEALGAQTEQIAFNELVTSLSTGAVDGQENPLSVIYHNKLYETQKYLAITNHVYNSMVNVMSKSVWDTLSAEQQTIIKEESAAAGNYMREMMQAEETELIKQLEEAGMEVTYPDRSLFAAEMDAAYERIAEIYGQENVDTFLKMCEDAR
jgi:tripartite ATP-independent transporter DctP family solute receptor